jgi:hypothetical protein
MFLTLMEVIYNIGGRPFNSILKRRSSSAPSNNIPTPKIGVIKVESVAFIFFI